MTGFGFRLPALMRHNSFGNFWCARVATTMAYQMQSVAIGWQIYDMTGSALDLGLVGLVQFLPTVVLSVLVGQAVDHLDRKRIARTCQGVAALAAMLLAVGTAAGWLTRDAIFAARAPVRHRASVRDAVIAGDGARHRGAGTACRAPSPPRPRRARRR